MDVAIQKKIVGKSRARGLVWETHGDKGHIREETSQQQRRMPIDCTIARDFG